MIVSYITEVNSFIEYAAELNVSANERIFYETLLYLVNRRSKGADFPSDFVSITNRQMLLYLPFAENSLIKARAKMLNREPKLFEYSAGYKNKKAPMYKLKYFSTAKYKKSNKDFTSDYEVKQQVERQVKEGVKEHAKEQTFIKTYDNKTLDNNKKITTTSICDADNCRYAYNTAWKFDSKAQKAVANNILNDLENYKANGFDGIVSVIADLLAQGMEPKQIHQALIDCKNGNYAIDHLKSYIQYHGLDFKVS